MKSVIVTLALISGSAFAAAPADFDAAKATMLLNTDKRIESLTKMKNCIQGATAMDAVKACKAAHHTEMAALKDDMIDHRIEKLREKKAKN